MTDTNNSDENEPGNGVPVPPAPISPAPVPSAPVPSAPVPSTPVPSVPVPAQIPPPVAKVEPVKPEPMKPAVPKAPEAKTGATVPPRASPAGPAAPLPPKPTLDGKASPGPAKSEGSGHRLLYVALAFIVLLAAAEGYQFYDRSGMPDAGQFSALQAELKSAQQRVAALEQRPAPVAQDTTRIAALETAMKALAAKPAPDNPALEQRLATLESRPVPVMPDVAKDVQTAVAGASAELNARIASLDSKVQQDLARTTRLRNATASLDAGKPIGDVAGANPALQRYATAAPPTEPSLRQSFGAFATAAEKASEPSGEGKDFGQRMWARAQQLVTVRQGDKVLVGAPAAVTLAGARAKLDAGDLAGAVVALGPLDLAAAAAMAPWKRDAQALLDARAALAAMATKS